MWFTRSICPGKTRTYGVRFLGCATIFYVFIEWQRFYSIWNTVVLMLNVPIVTCTQNLARTLRGFVTFLKPNRQIIAFPFHTIFVPSSRFTAVDFRNALIYRKAPGERTRPIKDVDAKFVPTQDKTGTGCGSLQSHRSPLLSPRTGRSISATWDSGVIDRCYTAGASFRTPGVKRRPVNSSPRFNEFLSICP